MLMAMVCVVERLIYPRGKIWAGVDADCCISPAPPEWSEDDHHCLHHCHPHFFPSQLDTQDPLLDLYPFANRCCCWRVVTIDRA